MTTPFTSRAIRFERKTGGDQVAGPAEEEITFDSPDVGSGYLCPGADGVKNFFVAYTIVTQLASGISHLALHRVYVGPTGTAAGDTLLWQGASQSRASNSLVANFFVRVPAPGAGDVVTFTHTPAALSQTTFRGGTTATLFSSMLIWEA